jgi:hypothetical protein
MPDFRPRLPQPILCGVYPQAYTRPSFAPLITTLTFVITIFHSVPLCLILPRFNSVASELA